MSSRSKQTFVYLWIFALLSASVGLSIHRVYCYCVGESTISFFAAKDACQSRKYAALPVADCCKKTASAKKSCCEKPDDQQHGCTHKSTRVFQLKTAFEVGHFEFKKLAASKLWVIAPAFPAFSGLAFPARKPSLQLSERPPPISGRMVCVRYGVFRC